MREVSAGHRRKPMAFSIRETTREMDVRVCIKAGDSVEEAGNSSTVRDDWLRESSCSAQNDRFEGDFSLAADVRREDVGDDVLREFEHGERREQWDFHVNAMADDCAW